MGSFFGWMLESSLLVLMILVIRRTFTGRVRYAGIYALWLLVLLRFLVPVNVISTPFSVGDAVSQRVSSWKLTQQVQKDGANAGLSGQSRGQQSGIGELIDLGSARVLSGGQQEEFAGIRSGKLADPAVVPAEKTPLQKLAGIADWKEVLKGVWAAVSGGLLLWFLLSNMRLVRRLKRSRVLWGTRGRIKIYAASGMKNPCLYGFFRPVIYIPESLLLGGKERRADEEELEQIITHEYVHYLHRDHIWGMFRMLLVSVYWFHPFVWLAVSCSKKDAELFCDETVIFMLGEERRFCYGEMLVRLAGDARWGDFRYSLMPMSRRGKEMERRIRAISDRKRYSRWVLLPLLLIVAATLGITCSTGVGPLEREKKIARQALEERGEKEKGGEEKNERRDLGEQTREQPLHSEYILSEYEKWLGGFRPLSGIPFKENASGKEEEVAQQAGSAAQQGEGAASLPASIGKGEAGRQTEPEAVAKEAYGEAFQRYIQTFTDAVNTGDTGKMHQVLAVGSEVYEQQCALVKNYYKRGIREEVKNCSISSVTFTTSFQVDICSKEKIKVTYGDATTKVVKQKYQYTCEMVDGDWIITGMSELS